MPIEVRGVSYVYASGVRALQDVRLSVGDGERVAFVGQNGSGKTTLVKHFNGLLRPTSGSVWLDGADIAPQRISDLAHRVGFAFQNPDDQIFRDSVESEVAFGPFNLGLRGASLQAATDEALGALELTRWRHEHPYTLSYAARKLVCIAGVAAMQTPVLVLDEPTTGQDRVGVERVEHLLRAASARGTTVLVVTHDMAFVARNFERVIVMSNAQIRADGPPSEVFWRDDVLAAAGLQAPPVVHLSRQFGGPRFWTVGSAASALQARMPDRIGNLMVSGENGT